jgi:hypothetical protein
MEEDEVKKINQGGSKMRRIIWLVVLIALFLLPSLADAKYKIVNSKGDVNFYLDSTKIVTEKGELVSGTGVVLVHSKKFPVIWLMIPDANDVIFLKATITDGTGPYKLFTKRNNIWGQLVLVK